MIDYKLGTVVSIKGSSCSLRAFDPVIIRALESYNMKCYKTLIFSNEWNTKTENIPLSPLWFCCAGCKRPCSEIVTICKQSVKKYGKFYFIVIDRRTETSPTPFSDEDVRLLLDMAKDLGVMVIFFPNAQDASLNFDLFTEQRAIMIGSSFIDSSKTFDELAANFGITPERMREIESNAMKKIGRSLVQRINAIEPIAQAKLAVLRDHLIHRLNDDSDPMQDYEVDVTVFARAHNGEVLYSSNINDRLFNKKPLDMEDLAMNHNDHPCAVDSDEREYHSYLYHDLIDHSRQYNKYRDAKVGQIHSIDIEVGIWEQFIQKGTDLPKAIQLAKANLPAHAITRSILSDEIVEPEVVIAAYMFDDDPDCSIEDQHEKREGVEDPYEGVIRYYGLHDEGEIPKDIARRTELLYTDIRSSLHLSFDVA